MKNLILNHKRLTIGIVLYIAVFIVSSFVSPWQITDITLSDLEINSSNMVMDKVPINILYFGIYELCQLLSYADSGEFAGSGLMFFISACALFSYIYFIKKFLIIDEYLDDLPEKIALEFIYDNIFAYIISLIIYYFYIPFAEIINRWFFMHGFILDALMVIAIVCLIIIPSIPHLLNLLVYVYSFVLITYILNYIDNALDWNIIIKTVIIAIVAIIFFLIVNIITNFLLEILQSFLWEYLKNLFPTAAIITKILVVWLVKTVIRIVIISLILAFVIWAIYFMFEKFA